MNGRISGWCFKFLYCVCFFLDCGNLFVRFVWSMCGGDEVEREGFWYCKIGLDWDEGVWGWLRWGEVVCFFVICGCNVRLRWGVVYVCVCMYVCICMELLSWLVLNWVSLVFMVGFWWMMLGISMLCYVML